MSKEVKQYEVTILLDASSSYTVEADSVEAAEHAAWEAHDEAGPSLCHQCSGPMDLGDAYGMLIYCEGKVVANTTHDAREIADLRAERDALLAERNAAQKDAERYRWLRDPCSGAERVIFYCRGDYGRGLMSSAMLDAVIDAALQGEQP